MQQNTVYRVMCGDDFWYVRGKKRLCFFYDDQIGDGDCIHAIDHLVEQLTGEGPTVLDLTRFFGECFDSSCACSWAYQGQSYDCESELLQALLDAGVDLASLAEKVPA